MAWTYTANPGSVPRDLVRFLLGDTDAASPLCDDGEVEFALLDQGEAYLAAAYLADRLAARYAGEEAVSIDGMSLGGAGRSERYRTLGASLRAEAGRRAKSVVSTTLGAGMSVVTGAKLSDIAAANMSSDRVVSAFERVNPADPMFTKLVGWS